mmetsp:Transcript_5904/g.36606  ORF Transcript_5904/g.36606 Transcript_5904/m.36606 type:complete len:88 (+) Transcript_5904:2158-2421(+)
MRKHDPIFLAAEVAIQSTSLLHRHALRLSLKLQKMNPDPQSPHGWNPIRVELNDIYLPQHMFPERTQKGPFRARSFTKYQCTNQRLE